jgi:DNA topoisomerase-1
MPKAPTTIRGGWTRAGRKRSFRYLDRNGRRITDERKLARIEALAIPPAWKDVWISSRANAKLQATGYDSAGRKQYLYHEDFRARQEQEKFDRLTLFGERLPGLREAMAEHLDQDELSRDRVAALALFRVGSERHARRSGTYGVTTLLRRHVSVRGRRIKLSFPGKNSKRIRTTLVDAELASAIRGLLAVKGRRLFKYEWEGDLCNLTSRRLNEYVKRHLGEEFTAKDFRTWGGTLLAGIYFAEHAREHGFPESEREQQQSVTSVMRRVAKRLENTPAVTRASYVSPAVVEQYLDRRTIDDFRPRHLRSVDTRETALTPDEQGLISLLRSWRIRRARAAA